MFTTLFPVLFFSLLALLTQCAVSFTRGLASCCFLYPFVGVCYPRAAYHQPVLLSYIPPTYATVAVVTVQFVNETEFLTADTLEKFFPYSLIRTSLHEVYKKGK